MVSRFTGSDIYTSLVNRSDTPKSYIINRRGGRQLWLKGPTFLSPAQRAGKLSCTGRGLKDRASVRSSAALQAASDAAVHNPAPWAGLRKVGPSGRITIVTALNVLRMVNGVPYHIVVASLRPLAHHCQHFLLIGELARAELRVQQLTVDGQLEAAAAGGDQPQAGDLLLQSVQQFGRQTDGLRFIVSE